jgi:hypothetical protein
MNFKSKEAAMALFKVKSQTLRGRIKKKHKKATYSVSKRRNKFEFFLLQGANYNHYVTTNVSHFLVDTSEHSVHFLGLLLFRCLS